MTGRIAGGAAATEVVRAPRPPWALALLAVLTAAGLVLLLGLGTWQVQRRAWKLDLIARVNARVHAAPTAPPGPAAWRLISADRDAYRRVDTRGVFLNDKETLVVASTERGYGFWVMTPLRTTDGYVVLVNRGFVSPERRDPARRAQGQISGEARVAGLLRLSEPGGGFLRRNDPAHDRWYSRDVAAIARARGLDRVAPYFIDADAAPNPGGWPVGGLTLIAFPNSHLIYALTWYGLAVMLAGWAAYAVREELRTRRAWRRSVPSAPPTR